MEGDLWILFMHKNKEALDSLRNGKLQKMFLKYSKTASFVHLGKTHRLPVILP